MSRSSFFGFVLIGAVAVLTVAGCGVSQEQYEDLQAQNRIQQHRIGELETALAECNRSIQQKEQQLAAISGRTDADLAARDALVAALEADLEEKEQLITRLQAQLLDVGAPLPLDLNVMLQEFAAASEMIDFDEATGSLRFKSDLLFELGSDAVQPGAAESLNLLAEIMDSPEAEEFDLLIVGHTDNVPIGRPETRQAHPTNWHLSVHRAISVMNNLNQSGVEEPRMAVKGHGEFQPVEENRPNRGGHPANRRVDIFIVPGMR